MAMSEEQKAARLEKLNELKAKDTSTQGRVFIERLIERTEKGEEKPVVAAKKDADALLKMNENRRSAYLAAMECGATQEEAQALVDSLMPLNKPQPPKV